MKTKPLQRPSAGILTAFFVSLLFLTAPAFLSAEQAASLPLSRTQLTAGDWHDGAPDWHPDGGTIVFHSNREGSHDIWKINADGSGLARLTAGDATDEKWPSYSPDGTRIAFVTYDDDLGTWGGYRLSVVNADGSGQAQLDMPRAEPDTFWQFETLFTQWIDDDRIAFVSYGPQGGSQKVYAYTLSTGDVIEITPPDEENPNGTIYKLSWNAAAGRMAFDRWPIGIQVFEENGGNYDILNVPRAGQMDTPSMPGWRSDGRVIAYVKQLYQGGNIGFFDRETGFFLLNETDIADEWPVWNPADPTQLAFVAAQGVEPDKRGTIWILTVPETIPDPSIIAFTGSVSLSNGTPAEGAVVSLAGDASVTTTTNPDGTFTLLGIPAGEPCSLQISHGGFVTVYTVQMVSQSDIAAPLPYRLFTKAEGATLGVTVDRGVILGEVRRGDTYESVGGATIVYRNQKETTSPVIYPDGEGSTGPSGIFTILNVESDDQVTVAAAKAGWNFPMSSIFQCHADAITMGSIYGMPIPLPPVSPDLSAIIRILQTVSGIHLGINDLEDIPDITGDGKIGIPEVVYLLQVAAQMEETRPHDERVFTLDPSIMWWEGVPGVSTAWHGVMHNGAGYRIEVPHAWNGILVMYAHGFRGEVLELRTDDGFHGFLQNFLIPLGYAWAASTFSTNYYDVRAGIEDTNKLALAFQAITGKEAPLKYYIMGHSMGGQIAAAAVEAETLATANNVVHYAASLPMCGAVGSMGSYSQALIKAAQHLDGNPATHFPEDPDDWSDIILPRIRGSLWDDYFDDRNSVTHPDGEKFKNILMNLSGGNRPLFDYAFSQNIGPPYELWLDYILARFGKADGTHSGIFNRVGTDTTAVVYRYESIPGDPLSEDEKSFNDSIFRIVPEPNANRLRRDGLRWIPLLHGEIGVPVLTLHDLGDLYTPFSLEQEYRNKVSDKGNDEWLVQRAIRSVRHCGFIPEETAEAFLDLAAWEQGGPKPDGDDVITPAVLAAPQYGCQFTRVQRLPADPDQGGGSWICSP